MKKRKKEFIKPEEIFKKRSTLGKIIDSKAFLIFLFLVFVIALLSIKFL